MNSLLRNRSERRRKGPRILGAILVVCVVVLVLNFTKPDLFSGFFATLGRPVWQASSATGGVVHDVAAYFKSKETLQHENDSLKQQIFDQGVSLLNLQTLASENDTLKATLGRTTQRKLIYAPVLQGPGFSPYDTFILDGGQNIGIKTGDRVTVDGVAVLGDIAEVYAKTSLARLYSSPGEELSVVIEGKNAPVKALGRGAGNFQIQVPQVLNVAPGTHIVLPGLSSEVVGVVSGSDTNVAQSLQTLYFSLPFNVEAVRAVYVESQ